MQGTARDGHYCSQPESYSLEPTETKWDILHARHHKREREGQRENERQRERGEEQKGGRENLENAQMYVFFFGQLAKKVPEPK